MCGVLGGVLAGVLEVVLDGVTGYIENPFDVEAFSGRIGRLIADPELADTMGAADLPPETPSPGLPS